ncbi:MAG TPA: MraY family glycosyltransferase [Bacillota bacterium]
MWDITELFIAFIISCATSLIVTPIIIKIALRWNIVDQPDRKRKTHNGTKPSMGGLAIFIGVVAGFMYVQPVHEYMNAIIVGACLMIITGLLDDMFDLKPLYKLIGQLLAALVVVSSGLIIDKLTIPFLGTVYLDSLGVILTIVWIVGASNAINLIDGLDGLAAGVSAIGLTSILIMAVMDYRFVVVYLSIILIGSSVGFLFHNFYPAKIFMGDTGALFLGYSIAIVSMLGLFKNVAFFSFIVPLIVIAIPIFDTISAIIRRTMNNESIATADQQHIHYQLIHMGYSHRASVLIIYAFSVFFGCMAIIFNSTTLLSSLVVIVAIGLGIQLIAELAGMTFYKRQPILTGIRRIVGTKKINRQ